MRKIWVVVRREFVERVRNKWFVITTVLGPVLMGLLIFLPILLATKGGRERSVVVVDATAESFGKRVTDMLNGPAPIKAARVAVDIADLEEVADSLAGVVGSKTLDGFLIVSDETVQDGRVEYRGSNVSSQVDMAILRRILREAVLTERLGRVGVDPDLVARATIPLRLETVTIRRGETTRQSGEAAFFVAYFVWFLMYMAIVLYGVQVMGAVVEEKTSRIVEVLVSSLKPFQLLAGKVVGVGAVGLLQLGIWTGVGWLLVSRRDLITSMLGLGGAGATGFTLPEIQFSLVTVLLIYFVLGYFLYAAMFAAVGAMSNSEAEARQAQAPVVMVLVIPAMLSMIALNSPDGPLARTLTLVPFSSPIATPVRWAAADIPPVELVGSVLILIASLIAVTWIAGRIYRVGILAHGKRPKLAELWRWVRFG
ncbi:MAG: ABC transporter permease [Gemmatimonadales bacterium]